MQVLHMSPLAESQLHDIEQRRKSGSFDKTAEVKIVQGLEQDRELNAEEVHILLGAIWKTEN